MFLPPAQDILMTCPYNMSHQILKSRFQVHLVRCRKSYKDVKKATCPFNVTHLVNEPELNWHVTVCDDRASFDKYKYTVDSGLNVPNKQDQNAPHLLHEQPIEASENWDDVHVPTYNPTKYASSAPILRQKIGGTPSERRAFLEAERKRLKEGCLK